MKISKISKIALMVFLGILSSCVDLEDTDFNIEATETFFETEDDIASAVVVVYDALAKGPNDYNTTNSVQGGVYDVTTILMGSGTHTVWDTRPFGANTFTTQSVELERMYLFSYFGISKANIVMENIDAVEMPEENRNKHIGEARFLRGLAYFNLVQYFGGVPLRTSSYDYQYESSIVPRASIEEVYDFIIEDFKFAETHLPLDDFDGDHATGRATSSAASGLLAKVYLTMAGHPLNKGISHYQLAKDQAQKVIDLDIYSLLDDYATIFHTDNENNREMLFSVQFGPEENDQGNWGGWHNAGDNKALDQPFGSGTGRISFTQEMIEAWHDDDPRGILAIVPLKNSGKPEKKKWKWRTRKFRFVEQVVAKNFTSINAPVLRYADILLTLAEAENEINGPTALAYDAVNQVRARARKGIPFAEIEASAEPADLSSLDQESFRDTVFWDRARELFMEGLDRFDLVRSGRYLELTENAVHVDEEKKVLVPLAHFDLLPIPLVAIRNNPMMTQNPGY